jgi:hypothetical protein
MAEAFGVEQWPTFLMFDPHKRCFYNYLGPRRAREMMRCDTRQAQEWPVVPHALHINIRRQEVQVSHVEMHVQTNGRLGLCAFCPTALCFALRPEVFVHLQESSETSEHGMHVMHFNNAQKHGLVFEMFGLTAFPTVLIYSPQLNLFFECKEHCASLVHMQELFLRVNSTVRKTWNVHPRIVLVR